MKTLIIILSLFLITACGAKVSAPQVSVPAPATPTIAGDNTPPVVVDAPPVVVTSPDPIVNPPVITDPPADPVVAPVTCVITNGAAVCNNLTIDLYLMFSLPRAYELIVNSVVNNTDGSSCITLSTYNGNVSRGTHSACGTSVATEYDVTIGENGEVLE